MKNILVVKDTEGSPLKYNALKGVWEFEVNNLSAEPLLGYNAKKQREEEIYQYFNRFNRLSRLGFADPRIPVVKDPNENIILPFVI